MVDEIVPIFRITRIAISKDNFDVCLRFQVNVDSLQKIFTPRLTADVVP